MIPKEEEENEEGEPEVFDVETHQIQSEEFIPNTDAGQLALQAGTVPVSVGYNLSEESILLKERAVGSAPLSGGYDRYALGRATKHARKRAHRNGEKMTWRQAREYGKWWCEMHQKKGKSG